MYHHRYNDFGRNDRKVSYSPNENLTDDFAFLSMT